jgi:hypothetical protein
MSKDTVRNFPRLRVTTPGYEATVPVESYRPISALRCFRPRRSFRWNVGPRSAGCPSSDRIISEPVVARSGSWSAVGHRLLRLRMDYANDVGALGHCEVSGSQLGRRPLGRGRTSVFDRFRRKRPGRVAAAFNISMSAECYFSVTSAGSKGSQRFASMRSAADVTVILPQRVQLF